MSSTIPVKKDYLKVLRFIQPHRSVVIHYVEILKPRETALLAFIGVCSAFIAASWNISSYTLALSTAALLLGSAGCNGLTNYLDRDVDSRMVRTKNRSLPSRHIYPARKALPLIIILLSVALFLSWLLNPVCFLLGIVGIAASSLWRKTVTCTVFGVIAGCCPVLIGWTAVTTSYTIDIVLICLLVALWIPIHVWSIMAAKKEEYFIAGLYYFPLKLKTKTTAFILFVLSFLLYAVSLFLFFIGSLRFHLTYLITANALGVMMIVAVSFFLFNTSSKTAWSLYKYSSFPYLGIIFLIMSLDLLIK